MSAHDGQLAQSTRYVAYFRVSTARQGMDGLGMAAQKEIVDRFVAQSGGEVIAAYTEVESGKLNERPQLALALREAKKLGATLLVGKLDRLGRNLAFIASLMEAGTPFIAADYPQADRLLLHMLAAFAEHERGVISKRTKEALAQAKKRGIQLGTSINEINGKGREAQTDRAQKRAERLAPILIPLRQSGASLAEISSQLDAQGIKTARGGSWTPTQVKRALARVG